MKSNHYIYCYTRAQAIEDCVLIDVSEMAKKVGFKISVAVTAQVWNKYIDWTDEDSQKQPMQDTKRRLWDVLGFLYCAIFKSTPSDYIFYQLNIVPRDGKTM